MSDERVAERRHLPVEHRDDRARRRRVRASCCRAGSRRARSSVPATPEARRAGGGRARRSRAARASSIAPTARPTGAPAVRGSRRDGRSRRVRPRRSRPRGSATSTSTSASEQRRASSGVELGHLGRRAQDHAVDLLHHVERRVVHRLCRRRTRACAAPARRCGASAREHRVLAGHVVRGGQHVAERRTAQHPLVGCRRRRSR